MLIGSSFKFSQKLGSVSEKGLTVLQSWLQFDVAVEIPFIVPFQVTVSQPDLCVFAC